MIASVILSFYNKLDVLQLLLAGFENQSITGFEIIIADDGSKPDIVEKLKHIIATSKLQIKHIWHPDVGWQKNIILNKAIKASTTEYLIFVDGDCIPHKHFVNDHIRNRAINSILTGRRVKLSEELSQSLTVEKVKSGFLDKRFFSKIVIDSLFGKTKHIEKGFRMKGLIKQVTLRTNPKREVLGCNFSMHKSDMLKINGFDERYAGPGIGEDIDIDLRFSNLGGVIKLFKLGAIQYHVYHPVLDRYNKENNLKIFNDNKEKMLSITNFGIEKN